MGRGDLQFLEKKMRASQIPRRVYLVWRILSRMCCPRWLNSCQLDSQIAQVLLAVQLGSFEWAPKSLFVK